MGETHYYSYRGYTGYIQSPYAFSSVLENLRNIRAQISFARFISPYLLVKMIDVHVCFNNLYIYVQEAREKCTSMRSYVTLTKFKRPGGFSHNNLMLFTCCELA